MLGALDEARSRKDLVILDRLFTHEPLAWRFGAATKIPSTRRSRTQPALRVRRIRQLYSEMVRRSGRPTRAYSSAWNTLPDEPSHMQYALEEQSR